MPGGTRPYTDYGNALLDAWQATEQPIRERGFYSQPDLSSLGHLIEVPEDHPTLSLSRFINGLGGVAGSVGEFAAGLLNALAPVGTYDDGSTHLAVPGFINAGREGWNRLMERDFRNDVNYGPDTQQDAIDAFAVASLVGTGGFASPKPPAALGVFAGRRAAQNLATRGISGPSEALAMAERMQAEGATPAAVYKATSQHLEATPYAGVHWGADGQPRFEISDRPNEIYPPNGGPIIDDGGLQLEVGDPKQTLFRGNNYWDLEQGGLYGPFVTHPELAKAYPEMANTDFSIQSSNKIHRQGGSIDHKGKISVFAPNLAEDAADTEWMTSVLAHELDHSAAHVEGFSPGGNPREMTSHPYYKKDRGLEAELDRFMKLPPPEETLYEMLSGETQARNTQARLKMSAQERRDTPPWLTQDYPYHSQIEPPQGALQRLLNPWLPGSLKIGKAAADARYKALYERRHGTPTPNDPYGHKTASAVPLAMDQASRLARARDMGFRDETVYHGTGAGDLSEFDLSRGGTTSGSRVGSMGVSVSPSAAVANEFAHAASGGSGENSTVLPLRYRSDRQGQLMLDGTEKNTEVAATLADAWDAGYDSVALHNYSTPGGQTGQKVVVVRNPSQLRSVNAAFDPAKRDSANLLSANSRPASAVPLMLQDDQQTPVDDPLLLNILRKYGVK